jgi:single-stranded-DNA-specific exonuclease
VPASTPTVERAAVPRLEIPPYDLEAAMELEAELGVSHVLSQVLVRRGLADPRSAREFLDPTEAHPPTAFAGIEEALELIHSHIRSRGRIVVHGDYDVDGVCATAIMIRALQRLGADAHWFLPSRIEDGYGLSFETVQRLAGRGADLLITVDCAITAVDEVAAARAAGIDVVVTDHHAPRADGQLPDCPVIHPSVCGYPCPELCGTAVAFKLAQALGGDADDDLELVALATVADLVPLRGENRRLVREGLQALANSGRPGLRALMAVAGADPSALDAGVLAFRLGPRINAAGRLARPDAGLELLLTEDQQRAQEIAAELDRLNGERRAVEQRIAWDAEAQLNQLGTQSTFVLAADGWHPGVIGIVASRIVERYHRPTILISLDHNVGTGSGRSIPGFDLLSALHATADHMVAYGGHRAAAGLTVTRAAIPALRAALEAYAEEALRPELLEPMERVDAVVSGSDLGLARAEELALLEPTGLGNPGARLLVPGARFDQVREMGEGRHARFSVQSGGARARAVAFGCEGRVGGEDGEAVDATFRLERNVWNGVVEPRLVLCHARPCRPGRIEVLGEPDDYLDAVFAEVDRSFTATSACPTGARTVLDRRGESPLAVLLDAIASEALPLAVCAEVSRRLDGLRRRTGGFALISAEALEREPQLVAQFPHVVALDPPSSAAGLALMCAGSGITHLAWGEAELRFAKQIHELEYGLRTSLVALYRSLRLRGRVAGEELEQLLRGDGTHGRPARLAGRLIRVLAELELVSLDRDLPALEAAGGERTALERSPAYRVYAQRYEDGTQFLNSDNLVPSA